MHNDTRGIYAASGSEIGSRALESRVIQQSLDLRLIR